MAITADKFKESMDELNDKQSKITEYILKTGQKITDSEKKISGFIDAKYIELHSKIESLEKKL